MFCRMDATGPTLPSLWFSAGGCDALWGAGGTYQSIEYDALPSLAPKVFDGRFGWLPELPVGDDSLDFTNFVPLNPEPILAEARALDLTIRQRSSRSSRTPRCTAAFRPARRVTSTCHRASSHARAMVARTCSVS